MTTSRSKRFPLIVTLALGLGLIGLVSALAAAPGPAASAPCDRWVVAEGTDSSDCTNAAYPCRTVQYAIDYAATGDTICVAYRSAAPGPTVYNERLTIPRTLTLDGKWQAACAPPAGCTFSPSICTPEKVVIDAQGLGRAVTIDGPIAPTVDCFTLTGGDARGLGGDPAGRVENDAGGGIYSRDAAPIIVRNVITANFGCSQCPAAYGRGGGIYLLNAPATAVISDNLIARNVADNSTWGQGGGLMLRDSDAVVRHNNIQNNRAGWSAGDGGGIAIRGGGPYIVDNKVAVNVAGQSVMGLGGGIYVWSGGTATIEHNVIEYNRAISGAGDPTLSSAGGGIYYAGAQTGVAVIRANVIHDNTASPLSPSGLGGGVYVQGLAAPSVLSDNHVEANIAGFNQDGLGGGVYARSSVATLRGNELIGNSATWAGDTGAGGGLYIDGGTMLVQGNTISGNNGAGFPGFPSTAVGYGGGIAISGSLTIVQANWIIDNSGTNADAAGAGGGVYAYRGTVRVERNTIAGNRATAWPAGMGGGVYLEKTVPWLDGNTILDNVAAGGAGGQGGGVRLINCTPFTLTNNIIARNAANQLGSGVAVGRSGTGTLAHNTLAANEQGDGVGVYVDAIGDVLLLNNIVVGHTTGVVQAGGAGSSVTADYTLFEDNGTNYSAGVVSLHEIAGPAGLLPDYSLGAGSGAIDHAPALAWLTWDIDGDPRPLGPAADAGADEYAFRVCLPLVARRAAAPAGARR